MALEEREHAAPRVGRRVTGLDERRMERGDVALSHPGGAAEVVDGDRCDALLAQSQGEHLVEVVRQIWFASREQRKTLTEQLFVDGHRPRAIGLPYAQIHQ